MCEGNFFFFFCGGRGKGVEIISNFIFIVHELLLQLKQLYWIRKWKVSGNHNKKWKSPAKNKQTKNGRISKSMLFQYHRQRQIKGERGVRVGQSSQCHCGYSVVKSSSHSNIPGFEGVSGWMCAGSQSVSSVPLSTQWLRDQPVSLTGMCATECWPVHWTELRTSDHWHCLAYGVLFMAVSLSGWLSAVHTAALQMDAGTAEATGLKIPSSSSSRPLHWEDETHRRARGHGPSAPAPLSAQNPLSHNFNPFDSRFPSFLHPSLPLFTSFYRAGLYAQPSRIWSVALGVSGPRLLNKGADWLIDRPSTVSAPHTFPSLLPHIRILCWPALR